MNKYKIDYSNNQKAGSILLETNEKKRKINEIIYMFFGRDKKEFQSSGRNKIYYNDKILIKIFEESIRDQVNYINLVNQEEILVNEIFSYNHKYNFIIFRKYKTIENVITLELDELIKFMNKILDLLKKIHSKNFIHGDVYVSNISKFKSDYVLIDTEYLKPSSNITEKVEDIKMFIEHLGSMFSLNYRKDNTNIFSLYKKLIINYIVKMINSFDLSTETYDSIFSKIKTELNKISKIFEVQFDSALESGISFDEIDTTEFYLLILDQINPEVSVSLRRELSERIAMTSEDN